LALPPDGGHLVSEDVSSWEDGVGSSLLGTRTRP